jgi:hypothetical protein
MRLRLPLRAQYQAGENQNLILVTAPSSGTGATGADDIRTVDGAQLSRSRSRRQLWVCPSRSS